MRLGAHDFRVAGSGSPGDRPAKAAGGISLARLGAALQVLAVDDAGRPEWLLDVLRRVLAQSSRTPSGFEAWLEGSLVVELACNGLGGTTLRLLADNGFRVSPLLAVLYPHLDFEALVFLLERAPERVEPAFISVTQDKLELSVPYYVDDTVPSAVPTVKFGYDAEETVVAPPSRELLRASRPDG
jgi:hypothetical protein